MTWTAFRTRGEILRAVAAEADLRRDGVLPLDLPGVPETFRDELDLLGALQLRWYTRLSGRIDRELVAGPRDLEAAVRRAWVETAEDQPGVRDVLDRQRDEPASEEIARVLDRAVTKERAMLARQAGLAGLGADLHAALVGSRIEGDARAVWAGEVAETAAGAPVRTSSLDVGEVARSQADRLVTGSAAFVARLKAALAA